MRSLPAPFETSTLADWRPWLVLCFGLVVLAVLLLADTSRACGENPCSPLVVAATRTVIAFLIVLPGLALARNSRRGSRFDPATGELEWWQQRRGTNPGIGGRIHPSDVDHFTLRIHDESEDQLAMVDTAGNVLPWFDVEVVPRATREEWLEQVIAAYPHIKLVRC